MWSVVDGIGPGKRSCVVRDLHDAADVGRRADRVRRDRESHHPRPVRDERPEMVVVDLEVVCEVREPHDDPEIVGDLEPRRDVSVVVEFRDHDLVARPQRPRERAAQEEVERGHARTERNLFGRAAEEARCLLVSEVDELDRPDARLVRGADVRVVLAQVARDRVDDLVRALRPSRPVEEGETPVECREARPDRGDVECCDAHETS
jgi:hypothetical protein